jgi:hypothetical protein
LLMCLFVCMSRNATAEAMADDTDSLPTVLLQEYTTARAIPVRTALLVQDASIFRLIREERGRSQAVWNSLVSAFLPEVKARHPVWKSPHKNWRQNSFFLFFSHHFFIYSLSSVTSLPQNPIISRFLSFERDQT